MVIFNSPEECYKMFRQLNLILHFPFKNTKNIFEQFLLS